MLFQLMIALMMIVNSIYSFYRWGFQPYVLDRAASPAYRISHSAWSTAANSAQDRLLGRTSVTAAFRRASRTRKFAEIKPQPESDEINPGGTGLGVGGRR